MKKADYILLGQLAAIDTVKTYGSDLRSGTILSVYFLRTAHADPWPSFTVPNIPGSAMLTAHYFFFLKETGYQKFKVMPGGIVPHTEKLETEILAYCFPASDSACAKSGFPWPAKGFNRSPLMTERLLTMTGTTAFRQKMTADLPCLLESKTVSRELKKELLCFIREDLPNEALLPLMNLTDDDSLSELVNAVDDWKSCSLNDVLTQYMLHDPKKCFETLTLCHSPEAYYRASLMYFLSQRSESVTASGLAEKFRKQDRKIPATLRSGYTKLMEQLDLMVKEEVKK